MHAGPGKLRFLPVFRTLFLSIVMLHLSCAALASGRKVYIIPAAGTVDPGMAAFIERSLETAFADPNALVIIEIDTFGGRVDSALQIVDSLLATPEGKTIAFVKTKAISAGALIALACSRLVMRKNTTIGDCAPITYSKEGPKMLGEKFQSPLRAKFRALAKRNNYPEKLAEAGHDLGGRVTLEAKLPGLSEWARVRDYRETQIAKLSNIEVFRESRLEVQDVLDVAADHVVVATGSTWRRDGVGRFNFTPMEITAPETSVFTPDDIMSGTLPAGRVILFDDDSYYMGGVIAERLVKEGCDVVFVTPDDCVSAWGSYTVEQVRTQRRLMEQGVDIITAHGMTAYDGKAASLICTYTGREKTAEAAALVLVTLRSPNDALYQALKSAMDEGAEGAPRTLKRIGDCDAPAVIAAAVYAGHRYARELDEEVDTDNPLKYDRVFFEDKA